MSQKKIEGIRFPTEIRVVGSYTDRLLISAPNKTYQKSNLLWIEIEATDVFYAITSQWKI